MREDVTVEYRGRQYSLPVLLVGSAGSKVAHRGLGEQLDELMDGRRGVVVLDGVPARAFYLAARGIAAGIDRGSLDWGRLLVDLDAGVGPEQASLARMLEREAS